MLNITDIKSYGIIFYVKVIIERMIFITFGMTAKKTNKMYNCFDVAKKFLDFASEEGKGIDSMKLLKLTYIAHGYYLAFFDKPLFYNRIEAWKHGPVIPELYHTIKPFKTGLVSPRVLEWNTENSINEDDSKYLKAIWEHYKNYTGIDLSNLTHQENTPWFDSYKENVSNIPISNDVIKRHYEEKILTKAN